MDRGWRAIAPWWPAPRCCGNSKKGRPTASSSCWLGARPGLATGQLWFRSGVPAICRASGVRWFCTHKLFWNSATPSPTASFAGGTPSGKRVGADERPIGTGGDPLAMAAYSQQWQQSTGIPQGLWLPGVGDHGGGPSQEMLEQLQLWKSSRSAHQLNLERCAAISRSSKSTRGSYRCGAMSSIWSCIGVAPPAGQTKSATTAPWSAAAGGRSGASPQRPRAQRPRAMAHAAVQQFHDILPGTSVPRCLRQAEPQWRRAQAQPPAARSGLAPCSPGIQTTSAVVGGQPAANNRGIGCGAHCPARADQTWVITRELLAIHPPAQVAAGADSEFAGAGAQRLVLGSSAGDREQPMAG